MKRPFIFLCILSLLTAGNAQAQQANGKADTLTSFPGGDAAFKKYIDEHLKIPRPAVDANINADLEFSFTIDEKGYPGDFKPVKRIGYGCEEQVIVLLRSMPRWQPGAIEGRRIKTTLQHTFHFSPAMKVVETAKAIYGPDKPGNTTESDLVVTRAMIPNSPAQFGTKEGDLATYITRHFTWPAKAPADAKGAIVLQFKIDETGSTSDVQVVTGLLPELDQAAINLVKTMPAWAAKQVDFKPAVTYKEITIGFKNKKALLY